MSRHLFLSPHLDDAVFSCGATLARLVERGHEARVVTIFTGNVARPQGFALECQTSKGIAPDVDYMKLRRAEDEAALSILGVRDWEHWGWLEAPHRGYNSPPELFGNIRAGDEIWTEILGELAELRDFDVVWCPQCLGNHVDHRQVTHAAIVAFSLAPSCLEKLRFYRDTPYAIRQPDAPPSEMLPDGLKTEISSMNEADLERKIAACCAYESQIGFQFGGPDGVREKLTAFHEREGGERFLKSI